MDVEYSVNKKRQFAYSFEKWEMEAIAKALKTYLNVYDRRIAAIDNNIENEGQATFLQARAEIVSQKETIEDIIKQFLE